MKEPDQLVSRVSLLHLYPRKTRTLSTERLLFIPVEESGKLRPLLCCDASDDGLLVAAGTDLQKEDAFILYW